MDKLLFIGLLTFCLFLLGSVKRMMKFVLALFALALIAYVLRYFGII